MNPYIVKLLYNTFLSNIRKMISLLILLLLMIIGISVAANTQNMKIYHENMLSYNSGDLTFLLFSCVLVVVMIPGVSFFYGE